MDLIKLHIHLLKEGINTSLSNKEPWQIVTMTTSTLLIAMWLRDFLNQSESVPERLKKNFFKLIRYVPAIKKKIDEETNKVYSDIDKMVLERSKKMKYITDLPEHGYNQETILKLIDENLNLGEYDWKNGHVLGFIFCNDPKLIELVTDVYSRTAYMNPLHLDVFPGICKMEAEIVRITAELFHGDDESCGTMTTGGTESIFMACKAYRDYARYEKDIKKPEIIIPRTAHAAFDKAAQYLGLTVRSIPTDPITTLVDVKAMKRAINSNTILLVGSAPNFPYGTIDDIAAISNLGLKYNIPVHVDSCLGGFLTAFMEEAGFSIPPCDFRLPGVTSISADTHKYGLTPKGSSVILYRHKKYRFHQFYVTSDWPGGIYGSPTVCGSRAGGAVASCWATILSFGKQGYIEVTRDIVNVTKYIEESLRKVNGIFIFGKPATSVIAIGSNDFDIYRLSAALSKQGWSMNILQFPSAIQLLVTHIHLKLGLADKFINDVKISVSEITKQPNLPVEGKLAVYGVAQTVADRSIVGDFTRHFLDTLYYTPKAIKSE